MRRRLALHGGTGAAATALVSLVSLALLVTACGGSGSPGASPSAPGLSFSQAAAPTPSPVAARPLIVDTDMSSDDVLALAYLLGRSPSALRAITVDATGVGRCPPGAANAAALAADLGVDVPTACGPAAAMGDGHLVPDTWRDAADALYAMSVPAVQAADGASGAVELMANVLESSDEPVDVLALGPLTNLAALADAHPDLLQRIDRVVMMGGAISVSGNVGTETTTGSPEWNVWSDPVAAARVFSAGLRIVMVPLDATKDVPLGPSVLAEIARDHRAGGANLAYELLVRNPFLVGEGQYLWDPLAAVVLGYPDVATLEEMTVRIGTTGDELGRTIRDPSGTPVTVATAADPAAFHDRFYAGLRLSSTRTNPFRTAGSLTITFDGSRCLLDPVPTAAGLYSVRYSSSASVPNAALIVSLHAGHAWQEVVEFAAAIREHTENPEFVDLMTVPATSGNTEPILALPSGTSGIACITADDAGTTQSVTLTDPFSLGE